MSLFGVKLRHLRDAHGLSQSELARRLNLASHSHISHLEASRAMPSILFVHQLATLFSTTTDYLLRDEIVVEQIPVYLEDNGTAMQMFGSKVRALRKARQWTQTDLAHQLNLQTHSHISLMEVGKNEPSIEILLRLSTLFEMTTDELIRDSVVL